MTNVPGWSPLSPPVHFAAAFLLIGFLLQFLPIRFRKRKHVYSRAGWIRGKMKWFNLFCGWFLPNPLDWWANRMDHSPREAQISSCLLNLEQAACVMSSYWNAAMKTLERMLVIVSSCVVIYFYLFAHCISPAGLFSWIWIVSTKQRTNATQFVSKIKVINFFTLVVQIFCFLDKQKKKTLWNKTTQNTNKLRLRKICTPPKKQVMHVTVQRANFSVYQTWTFFFG